MENYRLCKTCLGNKYIDYGYDSKYYISEAGKKVKLRVNGNYGKPVVEKLYYLIDRYGYLDLSAIRELVVLTLLSGRRYFPKVLDIFAHGKSLHIILEYVGLTIDKYNMINIKSIIYQLALALYTCNLLGIYHLDIKDKNICINNENITLIDFGLSYFRNYENDDRSIAYITQYRAPENLISDAVSEATELWAFGCMCFYLANDKDLFDEKSPVKIATKHQEILGPYPEVILKGSRTNGFEEFLPETWIFKDDYKGTGLPKYSYIPDILSSIFKFNPRERITFKELLAHPYFDDIPNKELPVINMENELRSRYIPIKYFPSYIVSKRIKYIERIETLVIKFKLLKRTLFLAISLLDSLFEIENINQELLDIYPSLCLSIASDLLEYKPLKPGLFEPGISDAKLSNYLIDLLLKFKFDIWKVTIYDILAIRNRLDLLGEALKEIKSLIILDLNIFEITDKLIKEN